MIFNEDFERVHLLEQMYILEKRNDELKEIQRQPAVIKIIAVKLEEEPKKEEYELEYLPF